MKTASHCGVLALLTLSVSLAGCGGNQPSGDPITQARLAAQKDDFDQAVSIARAVPEGDKQWNDAQLLLGDIAAVRDGTAAALFYYEVIPRDGSNTSVLAARGIAQAHFRNGALAPAAAAMEYMLERRPQDLDLHSRLANILATCGQRDAAEAHLMKVLAKGTLKLEDLVKLTAPERRLDQLEYLRKCVEMNPDDPFVNLGLATEEFFDQDFSAAKSRVEKVVRQRPDLAEAQTLLGELTLDGDLEDVAAWHAQLPESVQDHFGIWFVRGLWARRLGQNEAAARCFGEAVRRRPVHQRAMYQLGQVLTPLDAQAAEAIAHRAAQLKEYSDLAETILIHQGRDPLQFNHLVELLVGMGREWEAWGWVSQARQFVGQTPWIARLMNSLAHVPKQNPPRFLDGKNVVLQLELSKYAEFPAPGSRSSAGPDPEMANSASARIRFADQASELGVQFTYFQSPDSSSRTVRMFESTGGGVGVLDFDVDGWPDLFLTQGEDWPRGSSHPVPSAQYRDQLFRNSGGAFYEVTDFAGLSVEEGYGQGCSCGDFDNDGFPDLYVANIGPNQLLKNSGDGTFADMTRESAISGSAWTTSCLILDLNADGYPDLYDVNYLQGERIFSIECGANRCSVRGYEGAPDQVQLSQGDGTFVTIPDGTPKQLGKGLGIVALFVAAETRPSLFIANDQVPNFFLTPTEADGRYLDVALPTGLALNRNGQTTASMGVASGDLNHDRRVDLFVTNFEGEANTLFLQKDDGSFQDSIVGTGLMGPGIPYVGWGTQFLDADNDGELDLVATNGHIADFGEQGVEYRMPTQFFRNTGRARFRQESPSEVGELFERKSFGRSLATLDSNRDGRTDFVISPIESPAVVATNQSENAGHWLDVRLHARTTARDAIGTQVEVHQGTAIHWQQLIAGDGFQVTNERQLHFGLRQSGAIDRLIVHWPSGATSTYETPPSDTCLDVVEGSPAVSVSSR